MIEKTCIYCGKTFETASNRTCYCSDSCRRKGAFKKRREWEKRTGYAVKQRDKMREKAQEKRLSQIKGL